jgi:hypothetical protein
VSTTDPTEVASKALTLTVTGWMLAAVTALVQAPLLMLAAGDLHQDYRAVPAWGFWTWWVLVLGVHAVRDLLSIFKTKADA